MGLMIHSLEGNPDNHHRDYFIYLLDYGWNEPLSDALRNNFGRMATLASEQKNVVMVMHPDSGVHFRDEVLSWHSINGDDVERGQLLPAVLVTNRHPAEFKYRTNEHDENLKLVLFPLKKHCKDITEVIDLIQKIFSKIKQREDLDDFRIITKKERGISGALANSIILEPNIAGIGFSFNKFINYFRDENF